MQLIKANVGKLKAGELVDKATYVVTEMTGNLNFATPTPTLASITAAATTLTAASIAAQSGAHADIGAMNLALKQLRALLSALAKYVNSASLGDLGKALTSGFEAAKGHEPIVHLDAPTNLRSVRNFKKGEISLRWKPVHGARLYQVYIETTPGTWKAQSVSSKASITLAALDSYKEYTFQVTALGAAGESAASDIVTAVAA